MQCKSCVEATPRGRKIDNEIDQKSLLEGTRGHAKSTQNGSEDPPGTPLEHPGPPRVDGTITRTLPGAPRAAKRPSLGLPGRPKIAHRDHREPPRSKKNAHVKRFCSKKVALPFSDCFFIDFRSFFGGADPCFVWPGLYESHFFIFRKGSIKSHYK